MIAESAQLGLLGLTVVLSVGGSLFASGRYIGKVTSSVNENEKNIGLNKKAVKELSDEINRSLNNGIRGDLTVIRTDLATVKADVAHYKESADKVGQMSDDIAYLRGQMSSDIPGKRNRKSDDKAS